MREMCHRTERELPAYCLQRASEASEASEQVKAQAFRS